MIHAFSGVLWPHRCSALLFGTCVHTVCISSPDITIKLAKEASNQGDCDWRAEHHVECAAAGTAWLLQFIEDLQQSRDFHKTCELILPNEADTIPEVLLYFLPQNLTRIVNLPAAVYRSS